MPATDSLPDLSPVADPQVMRCSGPSIGHLAWGTPAATCSASNRTEKVATATMLELVKRFVSTIYGPVLEAGDLEGPPTEEIMAPCNETLYRQCTRSNNAESMCYNAQRRETMKSAKSFAEEPLSPKSMLALSSASPKKVHPVDEASSSEELSNGVKYQATPTSTLKQTTVCLGWTLWLILLNNAPNDTVNRVMNTESFDYGSFWLIIDPPEPLGSLTTIGLAVVAAGYLAVIIKIVVCRREGKQTFKNTSAEVLMKKIEKTLDTGANNRTNSHAAVMKAATSLTRSGSSVRKFIKLAMKFGDLAVETILVYQMLESGSPTVLIGIFTVVVTSCAATIYLQKSQVTANHVCAGLLRTDRHQHHGLLSASARRQLDSTPDKKPNQHLSKSKLPDDGSCDRAEWVNSTKVTDKVAQLATMGELQTIQLTNRYLLVLPEELRRCSNLRRLSLEYTHTQTLPACVKEFTKLEYMYYLHWPLNLKTRKSKPTVQMTRHLESKATSPMVVLPDGMFDDMSSLTFMHLAVFIPITKLPSFDGLANLKSLTLALLLSLEEIPSFDHLHNLERIVLSCLPTIDSLPDFTSTKRLKSFFATDRGAWRCKGFLGKCDLSNPNCGVHPLWGSPAVPCTDKVASAATVAAVAKFAATSCGPVLQPGVLEGPPTSELMAPCNGTMWRQCPTVDGVESMCYNARFMGIACTSNPFPIKMRRQQIAQGVGDKCNADVEAWLGCRQ
ncbi:hypothetical protein ON010_g5834 [Phytophthora cinnamomi]|nr:hypothetical protein ON010_g5834 [Phytophthora cinnamomi]